MVEGVVMTVLAVGCLLLGIVIGSRMQRGETPLPVPTLKRKTRDDAAPEEEMAWALRDRRGMHFEGLGDEGEEA